MATVLFHPRLPLSIDGAGVRGRREGLTARRPDDEAGFRALASEADALVVSNAGWDDAYLDSLVAGDWVQSMSAGFDRIPVDALRTRGVDFARGTAHGPTVADHALALLLSLARGVPTFLDAVRDGGWPRGVGETLSALDRSTVTVVGLGEIGGAVVERLLAFGADVRGVVRRPAAYDGRLVSEAVVGPNGLSALAPETDALVLCVPLTDETRGLVDADLLERLPETAHVVNVARGPVVDEEALKEALEAGEIAGAGLDVFGTEPLPPDSPFRTLPNVVVTPHVAVHSSSFADRFADLVVENYDRRERGEPLRGAVT